MKKAFIVLMHFVRPLIKRNIEFVNEFMYLLFLYIYILYLHFESRCFQI
jgi:hypothetical protein